jgi:CzcA family heavy metal efflux pump
VTDRLGDFVLSQGRALLLVALSFALAGIAFAFRLPIAIFPETNFPRISIRAENGIAPVDLQMLTVTRPLEQAIRLVPGITDLRSVTGRGSTEINAFFRWDVDIQNALHLVQGQIAQIVPTLPPSTRFTTRRLTFSVFPMIGFSMTSQGRSQTDLWERAYYDIAPRLYSLPGVAEARVVGGRQPEYHVLVDPGKLNGYGFPVTKVVDALRTTNTIAALGMLQENHRLYLVTVTGRLRDKAEIEGTVVDVVKGTPVLVRDVARVVPGEEPTYSVVTANGKPAVLVNVMQQPDGNAVQIADAVNEEIAAIRKTLPPDIELLNFYDQSILVRDSIASVTESILIGLALSVVVLIGFLKRWRATLVAAVVIPVAILVSVVFLKLFHMTFNLMTLGGLAAAVGVVIDDAIVIVENLVLHLSRGVPPEDAAKKAIRELTPALIGSTLTPIVVFAPLVFLGGVTAVFFRALAFALVTALFASLFLAVFFTPVLARLFLRPREGPAVADEHEAELAEAGRVLRWLMGGYERALRFCLGHSGAVLIAAGLILGASFVLYLELGSGFLPEMDEGAFVLDYITPAGTSLQETNRMLREIEGFLAKTPEIQSYSRRTGAQLGLSIAEPNTGDFLVRLKRQRQRSLAEITTGLRHEITEALPAVDVEFPHILEDLIGDLAYSPEPIEIKVFHQDARVYEKVGHAIEEWLPKVKGVVDVVNQNFVIGPARNFRVDQDKAQRLGFGVTDVANLGATILDGQVASDLVRGDRLIGIRVRYPEAYRASAEGLKELLVTSPTGQTVPLSSIAHAEVEESQTEIHRENLRNLAAVTARLEGRDLGSAIAEIQRRLFKEVEIPPGVQVELGGLYQVQRESFLGLTQVLLLSVLLIFVILVFEFRSFAHPIAILVATVLCGFGALLALFLTHQTLNISSFMGAIMVVGIVHKNGILMLDAEKHYSALGLGLREAVFQAGRRRLRPILMTALATVFGMLPLALGVGSGAQLLKPLAIAVIGGVTVSMVLSLLVTPVLFCLLRERGL